MSALVLAAWIAATVARLAAALRRLADAVAPLTVEAPRPVPAPEPRPADWRRIVAERDKLAADLSAERAKAVRAEDLRDLAAEWRRRAEAAEAATAPTPAAVASPAPDRAAETSADVADPRALAIEVARTQDDIREDVAVEDARIDPRGFLMLVRLSRLRAAALAARVERYRAAVAQPAPALRPTLHYTRDGVFALCGFTWSGDDPPVTFSSSVWHVEPPATRCEACAAELRKADPHRFDTRLQGITDTSGDADELLSREPPFAGRGGSL